jgi:hypothetical protein
MPKIPEPLFDPPRWPGGRHICNYENLPAWPTRKELADWLEVQAHCCIILAIWHCPVCKEWHSKTGGISPVSGSADKRFLPPYKVQAEKDGYDLKKLAD